MNVAKSEMKMAIAQDFGRKFAEREESLKAETHRLEGAHGALKQAAERLDSVKAFYKKEFDEKEKKGTLDMTIEQLEEVMKAVDRCRGCLLSLAETAQTQKLVKSGEAQEAKRSGDLIEKLFQEERDKLAKILQAIDNGTLGTEDIGRSVDGSPTLRVVDGRPVTDAASDLAARRAAARAEKEKAEKAATAEATEPPPAVEPELPPEPVEAKAEVPVETPVEPEPPTKSAGLPSPRRQVVQRRKR